VGDEAVALRFDRAGTGVAVRATTAACQVRLV
jgi:hypothetical protein